MTPLICYIQSSFSYTASSPSDSASKRVMGSIAVFDAAPEALLVAGYLEYSLVSDAQWVVVLPRCILTGLNEE